MQAQILDERVLWESVAAPRVLAIAVTFRVGRWEDSRWFQIVETTPAQMRDVLERQMREHLKVAGMPEKFEWVTSDGLVGPSLEATRRIMSSAG
jgi:hypothetical protein